jgi:transcriptional regulator with XRE-family HTH domain
MRRNLNLTQQQLAASLKVALPTVGKWESSRSPTGESLMLLAAFAHQTGEEESAKVFQVAALSIAADHVENFNWSAGAEFLFPRVAEAAIQQIRAGRSNPAIAKEYVAVLRSVLKAIQMCVDEAIQAHRRGSDFLSIPNLLQVERDLRKELENEEKQTKKR